MFLIILPTHHPYIHTYIKREAIPHSVHACTAVVLRRKKSPRAAEMLRKKRHGKFLGSGDVKKQKKWPGML